MPDDLFDRDEPNENGNRRENPLESDGKSGSAASRSVKFRERSVPETSMGLRGRIGTKSRSKTSKTAPPGPPPTIAQPPSAHRDPAEATESQVVTESDVAKPPIDTEPASAASADPLDEDAPVQTVKPGIKPGITIPSSSAIIGLDEDELDEVEAGMATDGAP